MIVPTLLSSYLASANRLQFSFLNILFCSWKLKEDQQPQHNSPFLLQLKEKFVSFSSTQQISWDLKLLCHPLFSYKFTAAKY